MSTADEPDLPEELRLEGPETLRLLAHGARQRVLLALYEGRDLTATEAAALVDLTPSAMSYHLRHLERAGAIVQVPAPDGRERRYRRAAQNLRVDQTGGDAVLRQRVLGGWMDALARAVEASVDAAPGRHGWMDVSTLRLTDEELAEFSERLIALIAEYDTRSDEHGTDESGDEVPETSVFIGLLPRPHPEPGPG